jgi:hypothetical protein
MDENAETETPLPEDSEPLTRLASAERPETEARLPMSGIRVMDLGTFLAGPYAASVLGEFGAEVLKVEHPIAGDPMRRFGTPTKRHDATLAWLSEARNKKSVTIDLRQLEGVQLFLKLIAKSDVLIENFRPGTMEEWGLDWKTLSEANPGLIFCGYRDMAKPARIAAAPALRTSPMLSAACPIWPDSRARPRLCPAPCRWAITFPASTAPSAS